MNLLASYPWSDLKVDTGDRTGHADRVVVVVVAIDTEGKGGTVDMRDMPGMAELWGKSLIVACCLASIA